MEDGQTGVPGWIKALAAVAGLALIANGAFVWLSLSGRRDLVRKDYYQAGLEQDARLARRALAAGYRIDLSLGAGSWTVTAARSDGNAAARNPGDSASRPPAPWVYLEGSLCKASFSRPEDGREDRVVELAWADGTDREGAWSGPASHLRSGHWDVLLEWERDGKVFMESAFSRRIGD